MLISLISTLLAFVFGIISGLLVYCCIKYVYPLCRQKAEQRSAVVNIRTNDDLSSNNPVYEVVSTERSGKRTPDTEMELKENAAYGYFKTARDT